MKIGCLELRRFSSIGGGGEGGGGVGATKMSRGKVISQMK